MMSWYMQPAIARPAPTAMDAIVLGSLALNMYSSIMSRFLSPSTAFPMEENSAAMASLSGMMPPDEIEIEIRNATTDMNRPNRTISLKRLFFSSISDSSGFSRSDFIPLYPFLS